MLEILIKFLTESVPGMFVKLLESIRDGKDRPSRRLRDGYKGEKPGGKNRTHWLYWGLALLVVLLLLFFLRPPQQNRQIIHVRLNGKAAPEGVRLINDEGSGPCYTNAHGELFPGDYPEDWLRLSPPVRIYISYDNHDFVSHVTHDAEGYQISFEYHPTNSIADSNKPGLGKRPLHAPLISSTSMNDPQAPSS